MMASLSPEIRDFLDNINKNAPLNPVYTADALRKGPDPVTPHQPRARKSVTSRDLLIPSPEGHEIVVREYQLEGAEASDQPAILYLHGGCWIFCGIQSHDRLCQHLCAETGLRVYSPEYRLAPEHPFPAALNDSMTVARAIEADSLVVAGDSAGGNLATTLCLLSDKTGGPQITGQVLLYPITDITRFDTPSYLEFEKGFLLERSLMLWGADQYAPDPAERHDPLISPLLAEDLSFMPPSLIIIAEADILRDEGEAYAACLQAAGVPVRLSRYDGMIHAFIAMAGTIRQGAQALDESASFIRDLCGT